MDTNSEIRKLIDASVNNPYAYNKEDLKYSVLNYTECFDFILDDKDIKSGINRLYGYLGINEFTENISCIVSNSVNGNIAKNISDNIHIHCFDNDYYCSMASQIANYDKNQKDKIEFLFGDISQFFTSDFSSNFYADFIVTCPSEFNSAYKSLDSEMKYRQMNAQEYYTKRSIDLLNSGGICMCIIASDLEAFIKNKMVSFEKKVSILGSVKFDKGYSFIFIKKA
jgi:hypothetical protein